MIIVVRGLSPLPDGECQNHAQLSSRFNFVCCNQDSVCLKARNYTRGQPEKGERGYKATKFGCDTSLSLLTYHSDYDLA